MSKTLCKTEEDIKVKKGKPVKYKCKKCDRKAGKEKWLCKPVKI